jgi:hypothetical protein
MEKPHAPGSFEVQTEDEPIDVSWEAYHRRMTIMLTSDGMTEAWPIREADLEAALAADQQATGDGRASIKLEATRHAFSNTVSPRISKIKGISRSHHCPA